jgi:hypothetical protein
MIDCFVMKVALPLLSNSTILLARCVRVQAAGAASVEGTVKARLLELAASWASRVSRSNAVSRASGSTVVEAEKSTPCVFGVTRWIVSVVPAAGATFIVTLPPVNDPTPETV